MEHRLHLLVRRAAGDTRSDADLLAVTGDDHAAFAELVSRHGRLVWSLCRHLLAEADAEDAFQATFLALLRSRIRDAEALASWLHGTALRISLSARREAGRRRNRERVAAGCESVPPPRPDDWEDTMAVVHREVAALPEVDRAAFILCVLEGLTQAEAAVRLGRTPGAIAGQVARAKKRLVAHLGRRGVAPGLVALGTASIAGAVPPGLVEKTLVLPGAEVPPSVLRLATGTMGMSTSTLKMSLASATLLAAFAVGVLSASSGRSPEAPLPTHADAGQPEPVDAASERRVEKSWRTPETQKVIDAGLEYLAKNQKEDGSWVAGDYRGDLAITSLAGEAFLAAGYQPGRGPNGARLTKAIEFVLRSEEGGLLAKGKSAPMYEHGFAVHFLAEAYGTVDDKTLKDRMKAALTKAVKVIADSQNREGGWRYRPDSKDADISVTCCEMHALAAAKRAGFEVPQATTDKGIKFILACRDSNRRGGFSYLPGVGGTTALVHTSAAISALQAVGFKDEMEVLEKGGEFIRGFKSPGASELHFHEARRDAARVMKAAGGKEWETWFSAARDKLLDQRNRDGVWGDPKGKSSSSQFAAAIAKNACLSS